MFGCKRKVQEVRSLYKNNCIRRCFNSEVGSEGEIIVLCSEHIIIVELKHFEIAGFDLLIIFFVDEVRKRKLKWFRHIKKSSVPVKAIFEGRLTKKRTAAKEMER